MPSLDGAALGSLLTFRRFTYPEMALFMPDHAHVESVLSSQHTSCSVPASFAVGMARVGLLAFSLDLLQSDLLIAFQSFACLGTFLPGSDFTCASLTLVLKVLARFESALLACFLSRPGASSFASDLVVSGSLLPSRSHVHLDFVLILLDFANADSSTSSRRYSRCGATLSACRISHPTSALTALDSTCFGILLAFHGPVSLRLVMLPSNMMSVDFLMLLKVFACIAALLSATGRVRLEVSAFAPDLAKVRASPLIQPLMRIGSSASIVGVSCLMSSSFVSDSVTVGSLLLLRSLFHLGTVLIVPNYTLPNTALSAQLLARSDSLLFALGISYLDFPLPIVEVCILGSASSLHSLACLSFSFALLDLASFESPTSVQANVRMALKLPVCGETCIGDAPSILSEKELGSSPLVQSHGCLKSLLSLSRVCRFSTAIIIANFVHCESASLVKALG